MKRTKFIALVAIAAAVVGPSSATAHDGLSHAVSDSHIAACGCGTTACDCSTRSDCFDGICDMTCGQGRGFYGEAEALFFRYNRADGTRIGDAVSGNEDVDFDHEFAPRLTFGFVGRSGLGTRIRWFEFDETAAANDAGDFLGVDTYTVDIEAFERFSLNRCWDLELSGGVRYNEFDEVMFDASGGSETRRNSFTGWGGILGLTASRNVGDWGGVYGRVRQSVLRGDKLVENEDDDVDSVTLQDSIFGVTELAMGWEYTRETNRGSLLSLRAGYEWQLWQNYSSSFLGPDRDPLTAAGLSGEDIFSGPADVGFDGFTLSAALQF